MKKASNTLRRALQVILKSDTSHETDRELLRRFAEKNDQDAFAILVRRHTGLVLGACRRILSNSQDAEDACQATFLILSQKATAYSWQPSIANWLYTTARRLAKDARLSATQRIKRETQSSVSSPMEPIDQITGRELLTILDEELEKLPPIYREPLILCYLEGLSREEVAHQLAIPDGTVKIRLERGRKKLNDALTKRNVLTGIGLLALATTSSIRASSSEQIQKIISTIFGSPSPSVVHLAKGVVIPGSLSKTLGFAWLVILGITFGIGLGTKEPLSAGLSEQTIPPQNAYENEEKTGIPDESHSEQIISGRVLGFDNQPISGAELLLKSKKDLLKRVGTSDKDGSFKVTVTGTRENAQLLAFAKGYGIDFQTLGKTSEVICKLPKDNRIRGRLIDMEGKPITGVEILIERLIAFSDGSPNRYLERWKTNNFNSLIPPGDKEIDLSSAKWDIPQGDTVLAAITDREGRFDISGVGTDRIVSLLCRRSGYADTRALIVNRKDFDPKLLNEYVVENANRLTSKWVKNFLLHSPEVNLVLEREKLIQGTVKDIDTGLPLAGVEISFLRVNDRELLFHRLSGTTNKQGKFEIPGSRKHSTYVLETPSDPKTGYMATQVEVKDTQGYEPIQAEIQCKKGVIVTGKLIDKSTNKPIAGQVHISILPDNPFVKDYPTFNRSASTASEQNWTKEDGTFSLVTIPGPGLLSGSPTLYETGMKYKPARDPRSPNSFYGHQGTACKLLDLKEIDRQVHQELQLEPASQKTIQICDLQGKPLSGVHVTGVSRIASMYPVKAETDSVIVYNLELDQKRLMVFGDRERKLVGSLTVKVEDQTPKATLGKGGTLTGSLVDEHGKPLVGVAIQLRYLAQEVSRMGDYLYQEKKIVTNAKGQFHLESIIPGQKFRLSFGEGKNRFIEDSETSHQITNHGDQLDLGMIKWKSKSIKEEEK